MRLFLTICGIVFLCILGVFTFGYLSFISMRESLDAQSKAYVDDVGPRILRTWNVTLVIEEASPELIKVSNKNDIEGLFKRLSKRLGNLKAYTGSYGNTSVKYYLPNKRVIIGTHVAYVEFQNASGKVRFKTIRRDDTWQLLEMHVESDALNNSF